MIKYYFGLACTILCMASAHAGEPFRCHIFNQDGLVERWVDSTPIQGHGMQHFAIDSFEYQDHRYSFDGQSSIFSDLIAVRISSAGHVAMGTGTLSFSAPGADMITIECKNLKESTAR